MEGLTGSDARLREEGGASDARAALESKELRLNRRHAAQWACGQSQTCSRPGTATTRWRTNGSPSVPELSILVNAASRSTKTSLEDLNPQGQWLGRLSRCLKQHRTRPLRRTPWGQNAGTASPTGKSSSKTSSATSMTKHLRWSALAPPPPMPFDVH